MLEDKSFQRLPREVVPKHYSIALTPDLKNFKFAGEVSIKLQIDARTERIVLNSVDLVLNKVILKGNDGTEKIPKQTVHSLENGTVEFVFPEVIIPGTYELFVDYTGEIKDNMTGLYRSKCINQNGECTFSAVTQFESTYARTCFPCWDEPAIKSTFDVSLLVSKKLVALSNMPVKKVTDTNDLVRYDFETTPIMSTYLVAVVVGDYDCIKDHSSDGILVQVYTPPGKTEQGLFALEVATKALTYFKKYFNVPYPLPKMDLIAIGDFRMVAMENWGLLTFQESGILVDPKNTSALQKQFIAILIAHEIAHQWFGNLVTMEWWTHLWLNEGYASFVQFLCVHHLFPHYDIWTQFAESVYVGALELDSLKNSHPIEVSIHYPSEIGEIFDEISYDKGASVIRMLHHYIGEESFRKGMHLYLTRHQYKNTYTEDLWDALEEASEKPVAAVMSTWTKQMGFPVLKVSSKYASDGKGIVLSITQNKFYADGSVPSEKYLWMIPISVSTSRNPKKETVNTILSSEKMEIVVPDVGDKDWIKINSGTFGFYRTCYSEDMLKLLIPAIRNKSLSPLDRLSILSDVFAMVEAGHSTTTEVLKLLQAYEDETDYTVWSIICKVLTKLRMLLTYIDCEVNFKNFEKKLLNKVSQGLGWNMDSKETHVDILLRGLIMEHLALLDDEKVIADAQKKFGSHIGDGATLPADLRGACYMSVLRSGDDHSYELLIELYKATDLQEEKERIIHAFEAITNESLFGKILNFSISDEVRSQDTLYMVKSVAMTPPGRYLAWQFFKQHWLEFLNKHQGSFILNRMLKFVLQHFVTEEMAVEIETFFKDNNFPGTERSVKQAIECIRINVAWLARDTDTIKSFLKSF